MKQNGKRWNCLLHLECFLIAGFVGARKFVVGWKYTDSLPDANSSFCGVTISSPWTGVKETLDAVPATADPRLLAPIVVAPPWLLTIDEGRPPCWRVRSIVLWSFCDILDFMIIMDMKFYNLLHSCLIVHNCSSNTASNRQTAAWGLSECESKVVLHYVLLQFPKIHSVCFLP